MTNNIKLMTSSADFGIIVILLLHNVLFINIYPISIYSVCHFTSSDFLRKDEKAEN